MSSKAGGSGDDDDGSKPSPSPPSGPDGDGSDKGEWRGLVAGEGRLGGWGFVATAAKDLQVGVGC